MNSVLISSDKRRDYFWFPFHPSLRWPIRLLGIMLVAWFAAEAARGNGWKFPALGPGLLFFLTSFTEPCLRRKTRRDRIAVWLLTTLLLAALAGVAWVIAN